VGGDDAPGADETSLGPLGRRSCLLVYLGGVAASGESTLARGSRPPGPSPSCSCTAATALSRIERAARPDDRD
jgi:hypothetical protein